MRGRGSWAAGVIRKQARGRKAILRRANNLSAPAVVALDAPAGATLLTLASGGSFKLTGRVVALAQFTLTGVAGTYAALTDSETRNDGKLAVEFSPALPADLAAGAEVTFARAYAEVEYPFLVRQAWATDKRALSSSTLNVPEGESVRILSFEPSKPAPKMGDHLDGIAIVKVDEVPADDGLAGYMCHMDSGSAA